MSNCFSLFMAPVCADLGFSTTSWSMVSLISSFASAIGAMIIAGMYQKKKYETHHDDRNDRNKSMLGSCNLLYCIWQFYLIFGLSNIFMAGLTQLPISMLVTAWFEDRRATMMSIAYAGGGLGGTVWSPVLTNLFLPELTDGKPQCCLQLLQSASSPSLLPSSW